VPHRRTSTPPGVIARFAVLALGVGAFAASVGDPVAAVVTSGVAFLLFDGFVLDHAGDLAWHGDADLVRLGVLVGAALAGLTARVLREHARRRRSPRAGSLVHARRTLPRPRVERDRTPADVREVH
jgi:K+-sensing histidine kinase KdpD